MSCASRVCFSYIRHLLLCRNDASRSVNEAVGHLTQQEPNYEVSDFIPRGFV